MITGQLKYIVMHALSEKKLSGYSLMKHIQEHAGGWKPSAGSIYPLLEELHKDKWVTVEKDGRKKVYSITKLGRQETEKLKGKLSELTDNIIKTVRVFGCFYDKEEVGFIVEILQRVKEGQIPFHEIAPEIIELRAVLYELLRDGKISSRRKQIKRILARTIQDFRRLK